MNILQKIKGAITGMVQKGVSRSAPIKLTDEGIPYFWEMGYVNGYQFSRYTTKELLQNGYGRNPFVFMCVDKIASVSAQLNWEIIDEKTKKVINDNDLINLLMKPNQTQTWDDFYYEVISSLLATGGAYIRKEKAIGFSKPTNLSVLVPDLVDIITSDAYKDGEIIYYTYDGMPIEKDEIIHIKFPNILERTHFGMPKMLAGIQVYESSNNIFEAEAHLHRNLGITGVLSNKDGNTPILPKEQERMQNTYQSMNGGVKNFGRIMVTSASYEYLRLGMSPEDLQTLEGQLAKMRITCSMFGLDSSLFNDPDNKTYNNRNEAEKSMYETVIKPLTEKVNRSLSAEIVQKDFGYKTAVITAKFDTVAVLAEDKAIKHAETLQAVQAGIITATEARSILYPDMPQIQIQL